MKSCGASLLITVALVSGPTLHAQEFLGVPYDKWLHFETSALMSVTVTQLERSWKWEDPFHLLPLGLAVAANAAKETYDASQPGGTWDLQDVGTGALGSLFGIGLANAWTASPPALKDRSPFVAGLLSLVIPGGGHFYNGTPLKGWAYLGLEAGSLFPAVLTSAQSRPATYYGSLGLFGGLKLVEVLDAVVSASSSSVALIWTVEPDRVAVTWRVAWP